MAGCLDGICYDCALCNTGVNVRIAFGIEYDGSGYCGWQTQTHAPSVQDVVEEAVSFVANERIRITCAGRTDTGVHATAQVVHFDSSADRESHSWVQGCNANLPKDVSVQWASGVAPDFHARFKAVARQYRYIILNQSVRPALLASRVSWEYRPLDAGLMAEAARCLEGEHDFSSFRAVACQAKHPVRTLHALTVTRSAEFIYIDVIANAFLHHMVRTIAGTLIAVGAGEQPVMWVREVLEARDRTAGGVTASANGLYLAGVRYPDVFGIPSGLRLPVYG